MSYMALLHLNHFLYLELISKPVFVTAVIHLWVMKFQLCLEWRPNVGRNILSPQHRSPDKYSSADKYLNKVENKK